jgi:hypothetical protein
MKWLIVPNVRFNGECWERTDGRQPSLADELAARLRKVPAERIPPWDYRHLLRPSNQEGSGR